MQGFRFNEEYLSQIPALQLLINLGYKYLPNSEAMGERQGRGSNVLLENILRRQLKKINRIHHKGQDYLFSEENIQTAVQKLKNIKYDGLLKTNEAIYDLMTLGTAMEQTIEGDRKSFTLNYIDWKNPSNNVFHVCAEFSVERNRSQETARPDIVLFVNGIPFVVIEAKSPKEDIEQAVSQNIRNQNDDYIPKLFTYAQLLLGVSKNKAKYATTGISSPFWSVWRELPRDSENISKLVNKPLSDINKALLFSGEFSKARGFFDAQEQEGERLVTEQDKAIYNLCRPKRLLELAFGFTLFDGGFKKIARYQQFFLVKSALKRIKNKDGSGKRKGGIVWHTQGSGKSLTMVWLARALALDTELVNPRILLVTDRDDLDKQLGNTFAACGLLPKRAESGRHLAKLLKEGSSSIITTLIHKFEKAWVAKKFTDPSSDIFVLVDESHRTNFGTLATRMRQMLPNACYIGFTGTPLLKKDKNNFAKFGGLIDPHYSIRQAVADKAVVPLLYEGRLVNMEQNQAAIDLWFDRHTQGLTIEQKADLKRKYARAEMLTKTDKVVYMQTFDISEHFRENWQGTGFKAQLVAPNKATALKYQEYLKEIGYVSAEVIISGPDTRDNYEEVGDDPNDVVGRFWKKMMKRFGSEEEYTKQIINQFKHAEDPEILIVVSKLLTGFDAPRNTVLYICKTLREQTLLQAIARVNRLHEEKDYGYIVDYVSILGELDDALTMYDALEGYDDADLVGTLTSVKEEVAKLAQRYSDLWDIFKEIKNQHDEEAYEVLLADEAIREDFYDLLSSYSKTLAIALSTDHFIMNTDEALITRYKADLKRFQNLRSSVKLRYAEAISYKDYEPKIKKLLDTHIQADEVHQLNEPVNIFDEETFNEMKQGRGLGKDKSTAARADMIAHATKKIITERIEEDPAFYEKFSKLIQDAIDDFRARRLSDLEYLNRVFEIRNDVVFKKRDNIPDEISGDDEASAYYGIVLPFIGKSLNDADNAKIVSASVAQAIKTIISKNWKVDFWDDDDVLKKTQNDIDDYLYDNLRDTYQVSLNIEQMDEIIEKTMQIARHHKC